MSNWPTAVSYTHLDVYKRQVQVTLFIFLITSALNVVLETVGEDALAQFLGDNPNFSVFATALVGLRCV